MRTTVTFVVGAILAPFVAHADGGTVRAREASGPFLVTVFTAPEPLRAGAIDTSVLVQDQKTGAVILDATVNLEIQPLAGKSPQFFTPATREQATNKLLKAARIELPAPGLWALRVFVSRGGEEAVLSTNLQLAPATPRMAALWPLILLPFVVVALFALNQTLRYPKPSSGSQPCG
jgi:hypothetical protein